MQATPAHTPHGRGYLTSLNYFSHKNDFWSQANMQTCCEPDQTIIDFWHTDHGASDVNSTGYSEFLYRDELVGIIQKHDPSTPLLVFYAPHVAHCPLQVPKEYYDKFSFMEDDEGKCSAQTVKGLHSIDPRYPDLEYKCRQQVSYTLHVVCVLIVSYFVLECAFCLLTALLTCFALRRKVSRNGKYHGRSGR